MLFAFVLLLSVNIDPSKLTVPITPFIEASSSQEIWMSALADCESGGDDTIKVWDTNNRWSVGRYQYQFLTWAKYSKMFGTTKQNITDGNLQDKVTRYILDTKGWNDWYNCGHSVVAQIGQYPR